MASDRSLAGLPERQRDDVVEALIALVVIVLDVFPHDASKVPLANRHDVTQALIPARFAPAAAPVTSESLRPTRYAGPRPFASKMNSSSSQASRETSISQIGPPHSPRMRLVWPCVSSVRR